MKLKQFFLAMGLMMVALSPLAGCDSGENTVTPKEDVIMTDDEMESYEEQSYGDSDDQNQN